MLWLSKFRATFLVASAVLVLAASFVIGYKLGAAEQLKLTLKMKDAGAKAINTRRLEVAVLKEKSLADLERINFLSKLSRVRICPEPRVPSSGDSTNTSPRAYDPALGEDITDLLRQCLHSFGEINRALGVKN